MLALLALGLTVVGGVGAGIYINKSATESADLTARFGSVPAVPVMAGLGALLALFGGALLGPLGVGVLVGSLATGDGMKRVKTGLESMVAKQIQDRLSPGGAPALPGPTDVPPSPPASPRGAGLLDLLNPAPAR
jgi:hypothetical protein